MLTYIYLNVDDCIILMCLFWSLLAEEYIKICDHRTDMLCYHNDMYICMLVFCIITSI